LILFIICQSSYPCTEPLKHYSAQVSQPVSILFVIERAEERERETSESRRKQEMESRKDSK